MNDNPFTFDKSNSRLVVNCERDYRIIPTTGAIFLGALYMYNKKRFRIDQNFVNFMGFAVGACPISYIYANQIWGSSEVEAGILNNQRERGI